MGNGGDCDGALHQPSDAAWLRAVDHACFRAGQPALRVELGSIWACASWLPVRSDAPQMVQHRHGRGTGSDTLADAVLETLSWACGWTVSPQLQSLIKHLTP